MKILLSLKKGMIVTLAGLISILLAGYTFERISRARAETLTPTGQFMDVGPRLHYVKGGHDSLTVVFETGFDPTGHLQWYNLQSEVSRFATTVSYDRAGILWSERGENPKTANNIAEELHLLLEKIDASKPYILVGHSLGGMLLRAFVSKYPKDVGGIILIDSTHPNEKDYLSPELYTLVNQGLPGGLLKFLNTIGVARLMFKDMFPDTPDFDYQNTVMPALIHKSADGILEEQDELLAIKREVAQMKSFGSIPLCVITATDKTRYDKIISDERLRNEMVNAWEKMQRDLLELSSDNRQVLVENSSHYIHEDQPKVILEAIEEMTRYIKRRRE